MRILLFFLFLFLGLYSSSAHPGIGIVMDSNGTVFYTDLVQVWKITPDGRRSIAVRDVHTHELYIDKDDNLYGEHEWYEGEATDIWRNSVWCLSSTGEFQEVIPPTEGLLNNTWLIRDNFGNSFYSKRIGDEDFLMKETVNGEHLKFTNHAFTDIRWKYYSASDHHLYVVDQLSIKKVSSDGQVQTVVESLKEGGAPFEGVADRHYVFGIWTDTSQNVYASVYGATKVKRITPDGRITTVYTSPEGWSPCGGLTTSDGIHWIMEFSTKNETRVVKLGAKGIQYFSN